MPRRTDPLPSEVFRTRLKEVRNRRGLSQEQLAERLGKNGETMHPTAIVKIERGQRNVSLDEVIAFAVALDVAPIHLIVPTEERRVRVTAKWTVPASLARAWVRGVQPLPSQDARSYRTEVPDKEWDAFEHRAVSSTPEEIRAFMQLHPAEKKDKS